MHLASLHRFSMLLVQPDLLAEFAGLQDLSAAQSFIDANLLKEQETHQHF